MRAAIKFAIAWLMLAAILVLILGRINLPTYFRLARHGERVTATIVQTDCNNHGRAFYTFQVGPTRYSDSDGMRMFDCRSLHPGDSIPVYYEITDPTISRAIEPWGGLVNELIPIALACLIVPPFMIASFFAWYRKNKTKGST
jgi:hypothetical protein